MQASMSNSTIRTLKDELLEEYEPMTSLYWKKNKKPNIDIRVSPFAMDRQLEDQKFSMIHNRNPRGCELTKGQKLRSESFVNKSDSSALSTKAKVINKIVREVSGVHTYTLVPPIVKKGKRVKQVVDPDTHPLMKPYRDESTRNPIMCSFGHRPSSASRTFHPSTMNFRLQHEEVAAVAGKGQSGFGLQPAVLSKLLHAPHLDSHQGGEDDAKSRGSTRPPSGWEDPHDLFLPSSSATGSASGPNSPSGFASTSYSQDAFNKSAASVSVSEGGESGPLGHGGVLEHSKSWNTTSFMQNEDGDFNGSNSFAQSSARTRLKKKKKKLDIQKDNRLDASGWNSHFQVMERNSNESFELRKSGIAELKLMPLKERLTRYATLSVQESRPDPFCTEKKITDALLLSGFTGSTREDFDRKENPYYDAEVDEDVRIIQGRHEKQDEEKRKKIQHKKFLADLKTIPKCTYHPDQSVLNMHRMSDEEMAMKKSENESQKTVEFQSVGDLYNTISPPKKEPKDDHNSNSKSRKIKNTRKKADPMQDKIRSFSHIYVGIGGDLEDNSSSLLLSDSSGKNKKNKKKNTKPKYNIDQVFDHVMQPFDAYLRDPDDDDMEGSGGGEDNGEQEQEKEEKEEEKQEEKKEEQEQEERGVDITDMLQEQEDDGQKRGFLDDGYDYSNMRNDDDYAPNDDDLRYDEDEALGQQQQQQEKQQQEKYEEQDDEEKYEEQEDEVKYEEQEDEVKYEEQEDEVKYEEQEDEEKVGEDNTFVNQQYHGDDIDNGEDNNESVGHDENMMAMAMMGGDDDHYSEQEDEQEDHQEHHEHYEGEDDLLDNPQVSGWEQQQYVEQHEEQDEEGGTGNEYDDHNYDNHDYNYDQHDNHDHNGEHYEQEEGEGEREEEQENYDDQKLDFAHEELGGDGMFIENQY